MANKNIDYIIILSHLMDSKANLNSESKKRASKSIEIYEGNKNAKFITCGWAYRKDCEIPIAIAMTTAIPHCLSRAGGVLMPASSMRANIQSKSSQKWLTYWDIHIF